MLLFICVLQRTKKLLKLPKSHFSLFIYYGFFSFLCLLWIHKIPRAKTIPAFCRDCHTQKIFRRRKKCLCSMQLASRYAFYMDPILRGHFNSLKKLFSTAFITTRHARTTAWNGRNDISNVSRFCLFKVPAWVNTIKCLTWKAPKKYVDTRKKVQDHIIAMKWPFYCNKRPLHFFFF